MRNRVFCVAINVTHTPLHVLTRHLLKLCVRCLFGLCFCAWCYAESANHIRYGRPNQLVLTTAVDQNGELDNPLLRLTGVILDEAKITWSHAEYPAARLFRALADGSSNFTILVNAPQLQECCITSSQPIIETEVRIYRNFGATAIAQREELNGKKIITIRGYSYGRLKTFLDNPENSITQYSTDTRESAFAMLAAGRADYLLDYKGPAIEALQRQPIEGVEFNTLEMIYIYLALHRSYPKANEQMQVFEQIVQGLNLDEILSLPYD